MTTVFVSYEQALALKELGFDEPCFGYYTGDKRHLVLRPSMGRRNEELNDIVCTAPTFSQAFRWLREKYGLKSWIQEHTAHTFIYEIRPHKLTDYKEGEVYVYETYEEAELECLKKLIEIVKNK